MDRHNKEILQLAVPSIVSNITVPLLGLVDVTIAGHIGDATYIGAIAIGSMMFNIVYWVFGFLRMGTSGMTSQAYGRKDMTEVVRLLVMALAVGFAVAACFVILQIPLRELAIMLMNTPDDTIPLVRQYFNIVIWGAPAMLGLYGMSGWFIGMQNTRAPMMVAVIQNVVNVLVSLLLVVVFGMKIDGVATGTLIAQWTGFVVACIIWKIKYGCLFAECSCDNDKAHLSPLSTLLSPLISSGREKWMRFFTVNRDIFLRTVFLVAVNMFFTSAGASRGATILAVNTLLMTLFTLFSYFMDGFAYAGEALSGKYYGAKDMAGFHGVVRKLFVWGIIIVVLFTSLYIIGGKNFLGLLTDNAIVIDASGEYLPWAYAIPVAGMAAFVFDGIFIGVTATRGMLQSSVIAAVIFFAVYYSLQGCYQNHALWLAFVIYLASRGTIQAWLYREIRVKNPIVLGEI